jgi:hypothetical protein
MSNGYGQIARSGGGNGFVLVHRLSWELHFGKPPDDLLVCHRCDNRRCVRPDHLFLGTQADNLRDMRSKGRQAPPEIWSKPGERNPSAKLTESQVCTIRSRYAAGGATHASLAREYGVSEGIIRHIISRRAWKHVE